MAVLSENRPEIDAIRLASHVKAELIQVGLGNSDLGQYRVLGIAQRHAWFTQPPTQREPERFAYHELVAQIKLRLGPKDTSHPIPIQESGILEVGDSSGVDSEKMIFDISNPKHIDLFLRSNHNQYPSVCLRLDANGVGVEFRRDFDQFTYVFGEERTFIPLKTRGASNTILRLIAQLLGSVHENYATLNQIRDAKRQIVGYKSLPKDLPFIVGYIPDSEDQDYWLRALPLPESRHDEIAQFLQQLTSVSEDTPSEVVFETNQTSPSDSSVTMRWAADEFHPATEVKLSQKQERLASLNVTASQNNCSIVFTVDCKGEASLTDMTGFSLMSPYLLPKELSRMMSTKLIPRLSKWVNAFDQQGQTYRRAA